MDRTISGVFWLLLYSAIVMVPIALMLVPPVPAGRAFWLELGVALGFVGLTQIALQFVLIARFRRVTAPYGIDVVLHYHRQIAIVAVAAILLHPALIIIADPARLRLLNPLGGNWASRFGLLSVLALVATILMSLLRERFRLRYEYWRAAHLGLGVVAIVAAQTHVSLAGLYTNTAWKQAIWIGMAAVMVGLVVMLRVLNPILQRNRAWRVTEVREERGDTWSLSLAPVDHDGLRFAPGQFAWVKIADTPFTIEEHPFSFTSSAERSDVVVFGIKELGDFSSRMSRVAVGATAFLDGPHGAFSMDRYQAPGYVFIAGGVGITPFLSMLKTMADRGDPRPVTLIYADRSWDAVAFRDELDVLRERVRLEITYVLEDPPEGWEGEEGMVTAEVLERSLPRDGYKRMYLLCGPPPMMDAVQSALLERGVPRRHIQLERFALV
ncbi:MAG: ferric reductase-like transmembrane domain-containing protein [Gemmatimonadetes bacterium]|nr:ferric reductase-like transmembrane domain-containing protein [Gemmatimonadota bacterium]